MSRLCAEPYCPNVIIDGPERRCPEHARAGGWASWTGGDPGAYGSAWRRARDQYIAAHPICETPGCRAPASEVHHLDGNPRNNDPSNHRALCVGCHGTITGRRGARARAQTSHGKSDRQATATRSASSSDRRAK